MVITYKNLNVLEALSQAGFNTLLKAVKYAKLDELLESAENITIFAPDNEAFNKLGPFILESLMKIGSEEELAEILKYHIISSTMPVDAVESVDSIKMMNGKKADIFKKNGILMVNDAEIIEPDIQVKNGVIHKINNVLLPE